MGMIKNLMARAGYEKRAAGDDPSWSALAPGIGYHASMSARAAENLSTVLACTNAIATALASIPALIYRLDGDGNRTEVPGHPLTRLYRSGANPGMSWPDVIEHWTASALLNGNGLLAVDRAGNGQLSGLRFLPWSMVTVAELSSGRLAYDYGDGRGNVRRYLDTEVLHLRDRTDDGKIGRSRLSRAAETVQAAHAANTAASTFLANGARPSGMIEVPGTMKPEQRQSLKEQFQTNHGGAGNAGSTLVLDGGMQWKANQISPEDAEMLATRQFAVVELCRLFQVPPPIIQDYSHNTFTNSAQAGLWFATFCLAPWARKIEAEFARSVLPTGYELELDLSGFLRGDPETRWNAHKIAIECGVLDPDEVRGIEGWNPRKTKKDGGDLFRETDKGTLTSLNEGGANG